jgi:hypothetical protein
MSLAHLRAPTVARSGKTAAAGAPAPARVAGAHTAYCGASREPVYRTLNEASESGLEVCDTCLADSRRQRPSAR